MTKPEGATHKRKFQLGEIYFRKNTEVIDCFGVDYELFQWQFYDHYQGKWLNCNEPTGLIQL